MRTATADYRDAIEHLPDGTTLIVHQAAWDDYERLLEELAERPHFRISYDSGKLEIMTPLAEHEAYARFIDLVVRVCAEEVAAGVESYGTTTWKSRELGKGAEPDASYYIKSARRVIGKRRIDLESDPPPDLVVEIDVTNESLSKFIIYAALAVGEIWRYDGTLVRFYQLATGEYREVSHSSAFPRLTPEMLATALEQSRAVGQTDALAAFRRHWNESTAY